MSPETLSQAWDMLLTMGIAVVLAGAIGWEREIHGRPAGIRTHMLISVGVVLFTLASKAFANSDPSRIAAQIVTGIGFLGAGTILRLGVEVRGLTTAASIWATAAISMAVCLGGALLWVAVIATALALFTLAFVDRIERMLAPKGHPRELVVTLKSDEDVSSLFHELSVVGVKVLGVVVEQMEPVRRLRMELMGPPEKVMAVASTSDCIIDAQWYQRGEIHAEP